jgi:hypothetical protein
LIMPGSSARSRPAARAKAPRDLINVRFGPLCGLTADIPERREVPRSEREQSVRHLDAEHPGGRVVDDQLELRCLHDR